MLKEIGKFFERAVTPIKDVVHPSEDVKADSAIVKALTDDDPAETFDLDLPHVDREDC